MLRSPRSFVLATLLILGLAAEAFALTSIEAVSWFPSSGTIRTRDPQQGCTTSLVVLFDAELSAGDVDPSRGVLFYIAERDAGDINDRLFEYRLDLENPPAVGTQVAVTVSFCVGCNSDGTLGTRGVGYWFVRWCDLATGIQLRSGLTVGRGNASGSSEAEAFEFVVEDENGLEGQDPTSEDSFACGGPNVIAELNQMNAHPFAPLPVIPMLRGTDAQRLFTGLAESGLAESNSSAGGSLGAFFDPGGSLCEGPAQPGAPARLYVVASLEGDARCGIAGAEFRLIGMPTEWFVQVTPVLPGAITIGNMFTEGINIGSLCARGLADRLALFTLDLFPTTLVVDHSLQITQRVHPSNPAFQCPLIVLCDQPVFSLACVQGTTTTINPSAPTKCSAVVGVESQSWGSVKALYSR